jgi:hypothetical protein
VSGGGDGGGVVDGFGFALRAGNDFERCGPVSGESVEAEDGPGQAVKKSEIGL